MITRGFPGRCRTYIRTLGGKCILALIIAFLPFNTVAAVNDVCLAGNSLLEGGLLEEATTVFVEILSETELSIEEKQCAADALPEVRQATIDRKLAQAELNISRDDNEAAVAVIKEVLDIDAHSIEARNALDKLSPPSEPAEDPQDDPVARANALAGFGLHDEARDVLAESLKTVSDPPVATIVIPPELQYLSGGKLEWWREVKRAMTPWVMPVLEIVAAVIIAIVLFFLLRRTFFAKPMLQIEEFGRGGFEEEHFGAYFSHNLLSRLNSLTSGAEAGHVALVTGPIDPIAIPPEVEAVVPTGNIPWMSPVAWVQAIPALIGWLFPRRTISVFGELHSSGNRGVGVTVRLVEKKRILVGYAFWEDDFDYGADANEHDDEENLYRLAEYVAVWLLFDTTSRFGTEKLSLLGTSDWRSYAYFRAGFSAEIDNRNIASQHLYIQALRRDPGLRGARVNLALLFNRSKRPDAALVELNQVREEAKNLNDNDRDSTLYSALYNLAALKGEMGDFVGALASVDELLAMVASTSAKIEQKLAGYREPHLKLHLETIRPAAIVMRGGLLVEKGDEKGIKIIESETNTSRLSVRHQYNLACAYSVLAKHYAAKKPLGQKAVEKALNTSLDHLKRAFQLSARSTSQAIEDRSLAEVRARRSVEFEALIAEFESGNDAVEGEETELPLAELSIIGDAHAAALAEVNIRTIDELLLKTLTASDRTELANKLTVSPRVVTQWAYAMDLTNVVGVGLAEVNLLIKARVTAISELASNSPSLLADDLNTLVVAVGDGDGPSVESVRRWIEHANTNIRPIVV